MKKNYVVFIVLILSVFFITCNVSVGHKIDATSGDFKDTVNKDNGSLNNDIKQTDSKEISSQDTGPISSYTCNQLWKCIQSCDFSKGCIDGCKKRAAKESLSEFNSLVKCISNHCQDMSKVCVKQVIRVQCSKEFSRCTGQCIPKSCSDLYAECGQIDDGCGNKIDCGDCKAMGNDYICDQNKCINKDKCNHNNKCEPSLKEDCETCPYDCGCKPDEACTDKGCISNGRSCSQVLDCIFNKCLNNSDDSDDCIDNCTKSIRARDRILLYRLGQCVENTCPNNDNKDNNCPLQAISKGGACYDQYKACGNSK